MIATLVRVDKFLTRFLMLINSNYYKIVIITALPPL